MKIRVSGVGSPPASVLGLLWSAFWDPFDEFLELGDHLGTLWGPLGCLWVLWVLVGFLFQHFSILLGASGHSGVLLCPFVFPWGAFEVI